MVVIALLLLINALVTVIIVVRKKMHYWLPYYLSDRLRRQDKPVPGKPVHILFCVVDHFEPGNGGASPAQQEQRIKAWGENYPAMADRHKDADGKAPQHTWFYPPHHDTKYLQELIGLCRQGYGEIEMHLHHNRMPPFPDTAASLKVKIMQCVEEYARWGIFCLPDGRRRFAFVHGDWALANGRGPAFCGVNSELDVLKECGCYADFTFPTVTDGQPAMCNTFFYAKDDAGKPGSHRRGREVVAGREGEGDLLLIQGIIGLRWRARKRAFLPALEASELDCGDEPCPDRIDYWVDNAVIIKGRPDWKFIKLHTHGAPEGAWEANFGPAANAMYRYLEENYNDGSRYILHYVTAREMYNISKAAEAGVQGDPGDLRDYCFPACVYKRSSDEEH